jgi:hypothetical protein
MGKARLIKRGQHQLTANDPAYENLLPYHLLSPEAKKKYDNKKLNEEMHSWYISEYIRLNKRIIHSLILQSEKALEASVQEKTAVNTDAWQKTQIIIERNARLRESQYKKLEEAQSKFNLAIKILDFRIEELEKFIVKKQEELSKIKTELAYAKKDYINEWAKQMDKLQDDPRIKAIIIQTHLSDDLKRIPGAERFNGKIKIDRDDVLHIGRQIGKELAKENVPASALVSVVDKFMEDIVKRKVKTELNHFVSDEQLEKAVEEHIHENNLYQISTNTFLGMMPEELLGKAKNVINLERAQAQTEAEIQEAINLKNECIHTKSEIYKKSEEINNINQSNVINQKLDNAIAFADSLLNDLSSQNIQENLASPLNEETNKILSSLESIEEKIESHPEQTIEHKEELLDKISEIHHQVEEFFPEEPTIKPHTAKAENELEQLNETPELEIDEDNPTMRNK